MGGDSNVLAALILHSAAAAAVGKLITSRPPFPTGAVAFGLKVVGLLIGVIEDFFPRRRGGYHGVVTTTRCCRRRRHHGVVCTVIRNAAITDHEDAAAADAAVTPAADADAADAAAKKETKR